MERRAGERSSTVDESASTTDSSRSLADVVFEYDGWLVGVAEVPEPATLAAAAYLLMVGR